MAKIPRVFQNQFGLNGSQANFGQFGSRVSNPPGFTTKDAASIQALSAFTTDGWLDAINSGNIAPFLEDMNGLFLLIFQQICYQFQSGVPEWEPGTTYFTGSFVRKPGTTELYGSAVDNNTNQALPSQTNNGSWNYLNPQSVAPGVTADFAGASAPFGWLLCDGTSYPTASFPNLFATIAYTYGGSGANFNVPDLRGRTTIGAGQGVGLTNRVLASLVGEETVILSTSQIPAHQHGLMGAPNLQGIASGQFTYLGIGTGFTTPELTGSIGGGAAHDNMQPSMALNKIIKT